MIYVWLTWLFAPFLKWRARSRRPPAEILLIQTAKIGDFICTLPLLDAVEARFPDCRCHVLIHGINAPLLRHRPGNLTAHTLPARGLKGWAGRVWLYRLLRREKIDTVICLSQNLACWLVPLWAGVARRAGIMPNFAGSSYHFARSFLTQLEPHRAGRLLLDTQRALLEQLGIADPLPAKRLWTLPEARIRAAALLDLLPVPRFGLGVSSGNKLKELGEDKLVALARLLVQKGHGSVVLVGGDMDRALGQRIEQRLADEGLQGRVVNTCGQWDLSDIPALLSELQVYVGVDSGMTYLADAAGIPVVDWMGPADADDQRPTGPHAIVLRPDVSCAPCSHAFQAPYHCHTGTRACITGADPGQLASAALMLLERTRKPS